LNIKARINLLFLVIILLTLYGCSYTFTGASVPEHLESIAIPTFDDRSGSAEPMLEQIFTDLLTQKFIDDNTLQVREKQNANAVLECTITSLVDAPLAITGSNTGEGISKRKITITVKVVYRDFILRKIVWDRNFTDYGEYDNAGDLQTVRAEAIEYAANKIAEDIMLAVVSNW
jgi:hypothetical protein